MRADHLSDRGLAMSCVNSDMNTCCVHMFEFLLTRWGCASKRWDPGATGTAGATSIAQLKLDEAGASDDLCVGIQGPTQLGEGDPAAAARAVLLKGELGTVVDLLLSDGLPDGLADGLPAARAAGGLLIVRQIIHHCGLQGADEPAPSPAPVQLEPSASAQPEAPGEPSGEAEQIRRLFHELGCKQLCALCLPPSPSGVHAACRWPLARSQRGVAAGRACCNSTGWGRRRALEIAVPSPWRRTGHFAFQTRPFRPEPDTRSIVVCLPPFAITTRWTE